MLTLCLGSLGALGAPGALGSLCSPCSLVLDTTTQHHPWFYFCNQVLCISTNITHVLHGLAGLTVLPRLTVHAAVTMLSTFEHTDTHPAAPMVLLLQLGALHRCQHHPCAPWALCTGCTVHTELPGLTGLTGLPMLACPCTQTPNSTHSFTSVTGCSASVLTSPVCSMGSLGSKCSWYSRCSLCPLSLLIQPLSTPQLCTMSTEAVNPRLGAGTPQAQPPAPAALAPTDGGAGVMAPSIGIHPTHPTSPPHTLLLGPLLFQGSPEQRQLIPMHDPGGSSGQPSLLLAPTLLSAGGTHSNKGFCTPKWVFLT